MGNSNYFDELIVSYLSKELSAEEEAFVLDWINSSEANKKHFEDLRSTWHLVAAKDTINKINVDSEWDQFQQVIGAKQFEVCNVETKSFQSEIREEVKPIKETKNFRFYSSVAIAASILVVVLAWRWTSNNVSSKKPAALALHRTKAPPKSLLKHEVNETNKVKLLVLQDGTRIKLYGKSEMTYLTPFIGNKRDITLVGKAQFKVAKDKTKPFTVFSGDITTTALGTQFTVTAFKNGENIIVQLNEGKVVIKSAIESVRKLKSDYYLFPGQELTYNHQYATAKVRSFRKEDALMAKGIKSELHAIENDNPSLPSFGKGTWYMFNNQPLTQVFGQLASMFNVNIVFSKKEFSKIYFIGPFSDADSLDNILKQIGDINELKISKNNNKIIISK